LRQKWSAREAAKEREVFFPVCTSGRQAAAKVKEGSHLKIRFERDKCGKSPVTSHGMAHERKAYQCLNARLLSPLNKVQTRVMKRVTQSVQLVSWQSIYFGYNELLQLHFIIHGSRSDF
jgi:hypothetical protein